MKKNNHRDIEATKCDYKLSLETGKPKSWLKSVSAFANGVGGHIYIGYTNDTHEPRGLTDAQTTASKITELIGGRISPTPRYDLNFLYFLTLYKSVVIQHRRNLRYLREMWLSRIMHLTGLTELV